MSGVAFIVKYDKQQYLGLKQRAWRWKHVYIMPVNRTNGYTLCCQLTHYFTFTPARLLGSYKREIHNKMVLLCNALSFTCF